jgi:hypothetical protein
MLDSKAANGRVTEGFFNEMPPTLGAGSFGHANNEARWDFSLESGSVLASDFRAEFERHKAIDVSMRAELADHPFKGTTILPVPPAKALSSCISSVGLASGGFRSWSWKNCR